MAIANGFRAGKSWDTIWEDVKVRVPEGMVQGGLVGGTMTAGTRLAAGLQKGQDLTDGAAITAIMPSKRALSRSSVSKAL